MVYKRLHDWICIILSTWCNSWGTLPAHLSDTNDLAVHETHVNHEERGMKSEAMPVFVLASRGFFK